MATRKGAGAKVEFQDEEAAEEGEPPAEEEHVESTPYAPLHPPKNPQFFPARGPGRPHMRQVLSEPDIRADFLGLPRGQSQVHKDPAKGHAEYRKGLSSLLKGLEKQTAKRTGAARKEIESAKYREETRQAHELFLASNRMEKQKSAWTYTDGPDFFERPQLYEQDESKTCDRNQMLTGIFDVPHPDFRPPHFECNVYGGWSPHMKNIHNEELYEFRDKAWQGTAMMSPGEMKFKERLRQSIEKMTAQSHQDALNKTTGWVKKQKVQEAAGEHSCLKRTKRPWADQAVTTHTFFQTYPPYKPGDHVYETGLGPHITETDRALSYTRNVINGKEHQKSFWKPPKETMSGTNRRKVIAQTLLFANTRGASGLLPPSPTMKRNVLLKGTGSLSFSHFKDALMEPTYERFAPTDIGEPP